MTMNKVTESITEEINLDLEHLDLDLANLDLELADISSYPLPLQTRKGQVWLRRAIPTPKSRSNRALGQNQCDFCPFQERCREAVAQGDFIGCESALARELIS